MKNQIIRCKCIDMSVDGQGICKADGLVIFVKEMIVDEEADVKIIAEKKNYAFGIIDKLIKPSKYRIESNCPISYKCGGCDYRYIDYDYQLQLKKKVLINTFEPYVVNDIIKDDNPNYYRNKVQVPVRDHKMGFYRKFSNDIVEFDDCKIESEIANKIIADLRIKLNDLKIDNYFRHILIKHGYGSKEIMIGFIVKDFNIPNIAQVKDFLVEKYSDIKSIILNLNTKETNVILGDEEKLLYGRDYIYDEFDGIKVKLSLKSFYQVNYHQMLKLYKKILEFAELSKDDEVLDLYCGVGTISLYLARFCKHVTGVEIVPQAIDNANENIRLNNMNNLNFILADASKDMDCYLKNKDVVIVDPPRKGITNKLIDSLKANKIKKIVYVSCNPATLARDLDLLSDEYNISNIQPVDMFPYTTHVETVCLLSWNTLNKHLKISDKKDFD